MLGAFITYEGYSTIAVFLHFESFPATFAVLHQPHAIGEAILNVQGELARLHGEYGQPPTFAGSWSCVLSFANFAFSCPKWYSVACTPARLSDQTRAQLRLSARGPGRKPYSSASWPFQTQSP